MKRARRSVTISYAANSQASRSARPAVAIVYYMMLSIFLAVTAAAAISTYQGLRTHSFIETSGVVTERVVSDRKRYPGMQGHIRNRVRRLDVRYAYDFQGFTFEGHQIEAGTFGIVNGDVLRRFGSRLEIGRTVPVYVDPSDHRNAVLERGLSSMSTMLYVLFGFFGFGTLFLRVIRVAVSSEVQPGQQLKARGGAAAVQQ